MREFLVFMRSFGTWFLLFTQMVPISLLVSLEVVRLFQARVIQSDISIYCAETDTPTKVQSCNLNEELGQIDYIFSDKTGTLTCNIMEFRKLSAGFKSYGTSERLTDEQLKAQ
jgi:P-type E1-E2 ATPase